MGLVVFLSSCSTTPSRTLTKEKAFKSMCLEGSGKGRIELLTNKYIFSFESAFQKSKELYELYLDFPIVGERQLLLSLNPQTARAMLRRSDVSAFLNEQLSSNSNRAELTKAVEEFFILSSDFMRFKSQNIFPSHYQSHFSDDRFIFERKTDSYLYQVEASLLKGDFYERIQFKIFSKEKNSGPLLNLFLIVSQCDQK